MNARCSLLGLLLIATASAGEKADDGILPDGVFSRSLQTNSHWAFQPVERPELPEPVDGKLVCNGIDALLSISQLPGQVPATTVGLHKKAPLNAAMAAHRILNLAGA